MKKPPGFCRRWLNENQWASMVSFIVVPILIFLAAVAGCYFFLEGSSRKMGFVITGLFFFVCLIRATWGFIMESMLNNHQRVDRYSSSYRID
jgi:uncharacterized membrane protein